MFVGFRNVVRGAWLRFVRFLNVVRRAWFRFVRFLNVDRGGWFRLARLLDIVRWLRPLRNRLGRFFFNRLRLPNFRNNRFLPGSNLGLFHRLLLLRPPLPLSNLNLPPHPLLLSLQFPLLSLNPLPLRLFLRGTFPRKFFLPLLLTQLGFTIKSLGLDPVFLSLDGLVDSREDFVHVFLGNRVNLFTGHSSAAHVIRNWWSTWGRAGGEGG